MHQEAIRTVSYTHLKSNAFDRLDWFVQNCSQRGMYVILDMHGAFGSQNGMDHSGEVNDGKQLYYNPVSYTHLDVYKRQVLYMVVEWWVF